MAAVVRASHNAELAVLMLAVGTLRHYGWDVFPPELRGLASKGLGGVALFFMVWLVYALRPSLPVGLVVTWWAWEESQVAFCSFAFMVDPWPLAEGQAMCSAWFGFELGAIGAVAIAFLLWYLKGTRNG